MGLILPKRFGQDKPPVGSQIDWGHPLARGLVGCWLLNEGAGGRAHNLSGRGNHGALTNFAFPSTSTSGWNPGRTGIGLSFDGVDDYVKMTTTGLYTDTVTLETWTKTSSTKDYQAVLGSDVAEKHEILLKTATYPAKIEVSLESSNYVQWNDVLPQGQWTHIVVVAQNGIQWKLYLNGVDKGTPDTVGGTYQVDGTGVSCLYIGKMRSDASFSHAGLIDKVCIYNRALSPQEIRSLYEAPYQFIIPQRSIVRDYFVWGPQQRSGILNLLL